MSATESLREHFVNTLSASENGPVITSYGEDAMIKGQAFAFDHNISIASGEDIVFNYSQEFFEV